jgi:predicted nucleic acid-binding protein
LIYLDSSVLLELYLGQPRADEAREILDRPDAKIASWLLLVEVPIVLRRALNRSEDRQLLTACLDRLDEDVQDVGLVDGLTDVAIRIRSDQRFAQCRSLDALHVCTALLMREWTGRVVRVETFDERLARLAAELDLR